MDKQLTQEQIDHNTELLVEASIVGDIDTVKRLIPVSDPKQGDSLALWRSAHYGHTEIVKLLIPVSDPKAMDSYALRLAASKGHTECVKLLFPVSDPKECDSAALRWAAEHGYTDIVKLLLPVSDYLIAEQEMKNQYIDIALLRQHIDEYESLLYKDRLKKEISNTVDNKQHSSVKRKM